MTATLPALVDALLADELAASPLLGSSLGLTEHDGRMPDLRASAVAEREAADVRHLAAFEALPDDAMTEPEDRADRDLAIAVLRGRRAMRDWADWRRSPDHYTGPGLNGVFTLFLHRLRPDAEIVPDACARLRGVPALLEQARDNLDPSLASPLLVRRAVAQARGGITYTGSQVGDAVADADLAAELRAAGQVASAAYASFVPWLEDLAERATGDWAIGEQRYDALLREKEGLPYGTRGLRERGQAEYAALEA